VEPFGGQPADPGQRPVRVDGPGGVADGVHDDRVRDRPGRDVMGRAGPGPVGPCGDLAALLSEDSADRLDRMTGLAALVDERDDQRLRGSSSPAKKIEARRRMSLSSSSRLTLAFSSLISVSSSLEEPPR